MSSPHRVSLHVSRRLWRALSVRSESMLEGRTGAVSGSLLLTDSSCLARSSVPLASPASDSVNPSSSSFVPPPVLRWQCPWEPVLFPSTTSVGTRWKVSCPAPPDLRRPHTAGIHRRNEDMTARGHSPGGLKTIISSKSLDISFSRAAKVIFPFCSRELRNWTIWWVKARHFGTASWQTTKGAFIESTPEVLTEYSLGACHCSECFRKERWGHSRRPHEDRYVSKGPMSRDMQICGNTYSSTHILPHSRTLFFFTTSIAT